MYVNGISVRRAAKIKTGNYENTDVEVTVDAVLDVGDNVQAVQAHVMAIADGIIREKVDEIEIGKRREQSKAGRFGV